MTDERDNVPGRDDQVPTPIADLVADLLSQGLSGTTVVNAARALERQIAVATTYRDPAEERRRYERERKARQRNRKVALAGKRVPDSVPDKKRGDISLRESSNSQKELKEERYPENGVPDIPGQTTRDDWPRDYVEQFWKAYPPQRRTEKAKVAKKLALIRKSGKVTWAQITLALARYARSDDVARGFAKGPCVWLNGGCWDDEIAQSRGGQDGELGPSRQQDFGFAGLAQQIRSRIAARAEGGPEEPAGGLRQDGRS